MLLDEPSSHVRRNLFGTSSVCNVQESWAEGTNTRAKPGSIFVAPVIGPDCGMSSYDLHP